MTNVLVVDDMKAEADLISSFLTSEGYAVLIARDGYEALQKVAQQKPDVIISDWMMPKMGGLELCRALKKKPETANIPVIACTAKDRAIDRRWAAKQGVQIYLTKPYTREEILNAVKHVISK